MAVKRREQALQDYGRLQAKVEKYEEKEKTGPVLAKLHQVQGRTEGWGRSNRVNGTTIAMGSSFEDQQQNQDTSHSHPYPAPFSDSPDSKILFPRPEKSYGLYGKTLRPRTNNSWMRCHGSMAVDLTIFSPALSP